MPVTKTFLGYAAEVPAAFTERSRPFDLNDNGEFVGVSPLPDREGSYLFKYSNGQVENLAGGSYDTYSDAQINSQGDIVSVTNNDGFSGITIRPSAGGLASIGGDSSTLGGINDSGTVVGYLESRHDEEEYGFIWTAAGGQQILDFGLGLEVRSGDIANDGTIVGELREPDSMSLGYAFLRKPDGTLIRIVDGGVAESIDENGIVQGYISYIEDAAEVRRSWVWQEGKGLQYLDTGNPLNLDAVGPIVIQNRSYTTQDNLLWDSVNGFRDVGDLLLDRYRGLYGDAKIVDINAGGMAVAEYRFIGDYEFPSFRPLLLEQSYRLTGTEAAETIAGGGGDDEILGLGGDDVLNGLGGIDTIRGGAGNDRLNGGAGGDLLDGGDGSDWADYAGAATAVVVNLGTASVVVDGVTVAAGQAWDGRDWTGAAVFDTLVSIGLVSGSSFGDTLVGNAAANTLLGGAGDDRLRGGAGADRLDGGDGSDRADYSTAAAGVIVNLGSASVTVGTRAVASNTAWDGGATDTLVSLGHATGSSFGDTLVGNAAANWFEGLGGNDLLRGGGGTDRLFGGAGADRFDFDALGDSVRGAGRDVITDFNRGQGDRIDLVTIDADTDGTAGNQAFSFIGSAAFGGIDGQLRFAAGILQGDTNGDRTADFEIGLTGISSLIASDILL